MAAKRIAGLLILCVGNLAGGQTPADKPERPDARQPERWTILFRTDDPSLWDTDAKNAEGEQIAIPLKFAPASFRYVRLRRMDTWEEQILPLTPSQLRNGKPGAKDEVTWWN